MAPLRRSSRPPFQLPAAARGRKSLFQTMQDQGFGASTKRSSSHSREQDCGCVHYDWANTPTPVKLRGQRDDRTVAVALIDWAESRP
jgi:hypothetical protein